MSLDFCNQPLVTIGIPFFNAEKYLLNSIKSIFAQTFQNWELILVNDGSTDNSLNIAKSIVDSRVRIISDGQNKRLPARLNQIIDEANGKYIARMDADDISHPDRIEYQLKFLMSHLSIDIVGSNMCIIKNNNPICKLELPQYHKEICENKYRGIGIAHATIMGRREWFLKHKYNEFNVRNEDYELWLNSLNESCFANIPKCLYFCNEFEVSNFRKYFRAKLTGAMVIWKNASKEFNKIIAAYYVSRRLLQIPFYFFSCVFKMQHFFIKRRYKDLDEEEKNDYNQALQQVLSTICVSRI